MARSLFLTVIFLILGTGFWLLPHTQEVAAGVAIFLLGMLWLQDGFKALTGGLMERLVNHATRTTGRSLFTGAAITTMMQSSTLVSLITISSISAGLITLIQGMGVIFGANLGTTTGAWLVAGFGLKVDIATYAMPLLVFGVILQFQSHAKRLKGIGSALGGIGFLFLGIALIKSGVEALSSGIDLSQYGLAGTRGLMIYTGLGVLATVIMQSSHATLLLTITALASGQISYENSLAVAIGSNIGTTITAILGSISANAAGRQLAGAHLIFNLVTAMIALFAITQFAQFVDWFSNHVGIAGDNYPLKLAIFHSLFNLIGIAVMLPFIKPLEKGLKLLITEKTIEHRTVKPRYLNESAINLPDTALLVIRQEVEHLAKSTFKTIAHGLNLHRHDILSSEPMKKVVAHSTSDFSMHIRNRYRHKIKPLFSAILLYSTRAQSSMSPKQVQELEQLRFASKRFVHAIKIMNELQYNMTRYASSTNPHIQEEYNRLRQILGKVLRAMFGLRREKGFDAVKKRLQQLQQRAEEHNAVVNGTLDTLIRKQLISSEMATSLMNDCDFAAALIRALIEAAYALYGDLESLQQQTSIIDPRLRKAKLAARKSEQKNSRLTIQEIEEVRNE